MFQNAHPSSFRDPSGFVFYHNGILYRQVNKVFKDEFNQFLDSGLYRRLVDNKILIPHSTINQNLTGSDDWYQTLHPQFVPFISYPYEWCFDMLKDAALLTLEAAREAMSFGMMLKDSSAFNIQFNEGRMIFIDTLSFERYVEQKPWIAYRQFCEFFLAPLAMMHYLKMPVQNLLIGWPEGVPLALSRKLLPFKSKFNIHTYLHLHFHGSRTAGSQAEGKKTAPFSQQKMKNLLRSLEEVIRSFSFSEAHGTWWGYYEEASQREGYLSAKKQIVHEWTNELPVSTVIDAGANEGEFSEILKSRADNIISLDFDHGSINKLYNKVKKERIKNIHPIVLDLANPSPALGLNNIERTSFLNRAKADLVLALALVHHLAIGKNIPFDRIVELFQPMSTYLIIEFIPKDDPKIQYMLQNKHDIYYNYHEDSFVKAFQNHFSLLKRQPIGNSGRTLFLFAKNH